MHDAVQEIYDKYIDVEDTIFQKVSPQSNGSSDQPMQDDSQQPTKNEGALSESEKADII